MPSSKRHLMILIISLSILGLSIFLYRYLVLGVPLSPTATVDSWTVEASFKFQAEANTPIKARFIVPNSPPNYATLDEYFVSHNYGVTSNKLGPNRETLWSIRRATGRQSLYFRALFRYTGDEASALGKPPALKLMKLTESAKQAVDAITTLARKSSADIQTFAQETVKQLNKPQLGNAKLLVPNTQSSSDIVRAALMVLNQAKINALAIQGFTLKKQQRIELETWLAVYNDKAWIFIDPHSGSSGLPKNFLVWQYGDDNPLYQLTGGLHGQFQIAVSPTPVSAISVAKIRGSQTDSKLIQFSLLQLPISVQQTYKILLTVPIGAFIILLLRNFVGLTTFGTFMPVLIALAFRETHVAWGIVLFSTIVAFGLLIRFYLDHLRLLLVPRLATILTVVIILMVFISIISQNIGLNIGLSVALFPMVILTMTIERMCITWDERGAYESIKAGAGSLLAASITFAVMNNPALEYLIFAFPELLLVLIAMILGFGQYKGYRLFELFRFKQLASS